MIVVTREHENRDDFYIDHFEIELMSDKGRQIEIVSFNHSVDCPEDANMERDFNDVFKIRNLIEAAYEAGKNGEDLTFSSEEVNW